MNCTEDWAKLNETGGSSLEIYFWLLGLATVRLVRFCFLRVFLLAACVDTVRFPQLKI